MPVDNNTTGIDFKGMDIDKLISLISGKKKNPFDGLADAILLPEIKEEYTPRTLPENIAADARMQDIYNKAASMQINSEPFLRLLALNTYDMMHPTLLDTINTTVLNYTSGFNDIANIPNPISPTALMVNSVNNLSIDVKEPTLQSFREEELVSQILKKNSEIKANADKEEKITAWGKGMSIAGAAGDLLNSFLPEKREYSGRKGAITAGLDSAYDQLADAASKFGPVGSIVSGAMKINAGLGKVANLTGAGTDAMTTQDAILGSNFIGPVGWVNGWGGKTTSTITKDNEAFAQVGSSYGGTSNTVDEALEVSGKKYGLLSNSARKKAERQLAEARRQQNIVQGISEDAQIRSTLQGTMSDILSNRYGLLLQGGYNQSAIHVGKRGLKISPYKARRLVSNVTFYQKGGPVTKDRVLEELIEYAKELNPRFIQRLMEKPTQWVETPSGLPGTHLLSYSNEGSEWYVWPLIQELNGQLTYIPNPKDAMDKAMQDGDYLRFNSEEEAKNFSENYKKGFPKFFEEFEKLISNKVEKDEQGTKIASYIEPVDLNLIITTFKEGGIIPSMIETIIEPVLIITEIVPLELELIESFLNGGEINVIPDGALHKNLHHMEDAEHLTKKGIPVVAIDNGELVAEIEKNEIILRKSVTEKLEELCELYYSEDATKELKDDYALEAGELLVDEILNNTIDNTNKLL